MVTRGTDPTKCRPSSADQVKLGWEFWPASKVTVAAPARPGRPARPARPARWCNAGRSSSIISWNWVTSTLLPG